MKRTVAFVAVAGAMLFPQTSSADAVADFYDGKTVKIIIGASMPAWAIAEGVPIQLAT